MLPTLFILALFLWYFWYFYGSLGAPIPRPKHGSPHPPTAYHPQLEYSSKQDKFRFKVHRRVAWEHRVPDLFMFRNQRLVEQDACHNVPDEGKVSATGLVLYEYLRDHPQLQPPHFQKDAAATVVRKGSVFYFTCRGKRVWRLGQCPSGQMFVRNACVAVTPCTGQEDGVVLPLSPDDKSRYLRCEGGLTYPETCPTDTFFLLDACRSQTDLSYYCQFTDASFFVEAFQTRIDCMNGRPVYTRCPDGFRFFDEADCEPTTCQGRSDGTLISSGPAFNDGTFTYFTGYKQCVGGRLASPALECPSSWESRDPANQDHLLQLPMVFDGEKCAVPTFCINVQPVDRDTTIVPVYEWRQHVAHWHRAFQYDHLEGYQCDVKPTDPDDPMSHRKRLRMEPGITIHPKRFRRTEGCPDDRSLLPVPGSDDHYFDCQSQTVGPCPPGQRFNGTECRDPLPHPFRYQGRDLFQLDSLSHDNWIVPWKYVPKGSPAVQCAVAGDSVNTLYNLCSDPDCERYPYLSQLPSFSIYHPKGYRCFFDPSDRRLKKEKVVVPATFDFWTQRQQPDSQRCEPGQRLQTGHFVWDNLFYATCHPDQPFVFCPSSETDGIVRVEGGPQRYACRLPESKRDTSVLGRPNETTTAHFELNEVARIHPTLSDQEVQLKAGEPWIRLPSEGMAIVSALDLTVRAPVVLYHRYRVTHPPDVSYHHQELYKVSSKGGGFLCRRADFTQRALTFPTYHVQPFASDFMD